MKRRDIIKGLTALPVAYGVMGSVIPPDSAVAASKVMAGAKRNLFQELGIRTFINARGTITSMSGSLMHDYVLDAIKDTSKEFCMLDELQDKVGERIAEMTHAEAATVTSGAFSALTLGMAGILTGMDLEKVERLPHLEGSGMKSEVIIQNTHKIHYNHALLNCGVKLVYVETPDDVDRAVNENTASMHFLGSALLRGKINYEDWIALSKKHKLPATIDIAANIPPVSNIWKFNDMGYSFVALSGGKAIRGPQSAGILMGKKDIIAAARLSAPPRGFNVGRGMKVNKEEIFGMYVALEHYLRQDHDKEWKEWEARVRRIAVAAETVNGVQTESYVPPIADHTPTLRISWNTNIVKLSGDGMLQALNNGDPSIVAYGGGKNSIAVSPWMMLPDQVGIVANRIREELEKARV
ncbi:selenocysteine synthase [Flavobacteriaceae bacterium F89]|uniref:Selenocysteine synthase n=1 Tax=Cerina litoralis TaxID=2874477 RepID=A0AAE3ETB1_9FLAO|nr:selenocysteine synthase [Cerina litoralis]MCG2459326.1 selenocysteine synthase [Cerina litoralis]